jgi:ribosome-associated toxin RatA of RatAB toxin-antitoxin module
VRTVKLDFIVPSATTQDVYATVADFARYPEHSSAIRHVDVVPKDADSSLSSWEVNFRSGILRWIEEDRFDPVRRHIDFRQVEGDMAVFEGAWNCASEGSDVAMTFFARLDLGIPSLADALEPIATRTLVTNTIAIVTGLFGDTVRVRDVDDGTTTEPDPAISERG